MTSEKKNLGASVRAKLLNISRETGDEYNLVLTRFVVERFLYRLSISEYRDSFVLKGAALFSIWFGESHRPTRDVDLLGFESDDIVEIEKIIKIICSIEDDDGLAFDLETVKGEAIRENVYYGGVRIKFNAFLAGAKISTQIDIGFGDAITPASVESEYPTLLKMSTPILRIYPMETVIPEKFEAMVKLGISNGRMKDFWDLSYLIKKTKFENALLKSAISQTFTNRNTEIPIRLPIASRDEFAENPLVLIRWRTFIERNGIKADTDLRSVITSLRIFFSEILEFDEN